MGDGERTSLLQQRATKDAVKEGTNTMGGDTGKVIRALVGFAYPSYQSLQAAMTEDPDDDLQWLRYWVVLATVHMIELVVDPLVDFFPGYLLAKCAFLIWCMAPVQNNGANLIFSQVILPLFKKHHGKIDHQVGMVQDTVKDKIQKMVYGEEETSKSGWW